MPIEEPPESPPLEGGPPPDKFVEVVGVCRALAVAVPGCIGPLLPMGTGPEDDVEVGVSARPGRVVGVGVGVGVPGPIVGVGDGVLVAVGFGEGVAVGGGAGQLQDADALLNSKVARAGQGTLGILIVIATLFLPASEPLAGLKVMPDTPELLAFQDNLPLVLFVNVTEQVQQLLKTVGMTMKSGLADCW